MVRSLSGQKEVCICPGLCPIEEIQGRSATGEKHRSAMQLGSISNLILDQFPSRERPHIKKNKVAVNPDICFMLCLIAKNVVAHKSNFPRVGELMLPWNTRMDFFKDIRSCYFQRFRIHFRGIIAADKAVIRTYDGILSRQAITFYSDIKQGVDDDSLFLNLFPDGSRCLHKFFLKNRHIRIPENLEG